MPEDAIDATTTMTVKEEDGDTTNDPAAKVLGGEEEEEEECIEDLELYRLDYEDEDTTNKSVSAAVVEQEDDLIGGPKAAGGEILQPGDHVYMWCTLYQHHGIVLETTNNDNHNNENHDTSILIAEFTNLALLGATTIGMSASTASGAVSTTTGVTGGFRFVRETNPQQWHKVKYQAHALESLSWRPGTCSIATPSSVVTILTRVQFLRDCRHLIPDYHLLASNCETVAVWCRTGQWETLQGGRALQLSQVASMALLPVATGVGLALGGLTFWHSRQLDQKRDQTAAVLNSQFEWYSMGKTIRDFQFQVTEA